GPGPGTGAGAAEQPLADLPGRDPARRVRREHERDPLGMTAGQPRVPAAASTQAADPSREVDASRGGSGDPAGHGTVGPSERGKKRLKTGPSNWLLLPALSFFGIFALLPLAGVVLLSFFAWDGLGTPSFAGLTAWFTVFQDPVTLNAMWLTLLMTVLSYVVQFPSACCWGRSWPGTSATARSSRCCTSCRCCSRRPPWASRSRRCWTRTSASRAPSAWTCCAKTGWARPTSHSTP